jgi:hypothetical protein
MRQGEILGLRRQGRRALRASAGAHGPPFPRPGDRGNALAEPKTAGSRRTLELEAVGWATRGQVIQATMTAAAALRATEGHSTLDGSPTARMIPASGKR